MKRSTLPAALLTAAIAAAPLAALADGTWGQGGHFDSAGHYGNAVARAGGTIAEVRGGMLRLQDGRPIFLRRGTVINPTGIDLRPGMRITVRGEPGGNGAINAEVIEVERGYANDRWNGNANGSRDWSRPDRSENR